jgi:hypothetical protein
LDRGRATSLPTLEEAGRVNHAIFSQEIGVVEQKKKEKGAIDIGLRPSNRGVYGRCRQENQNIHPAEHGPHQAGTDGACKAAIQAA